MDTLHVDLLVIGFGKGGKTVAAATGRRGLRVAMVEQSDQMYGGTCINIGCVPTKALVHDAESRRPGDTPADWYARAVTRKADLTALLRGKNFDMLDVIDSVTVVTGRATFVGPREVEVRAGDDVLRIDAETVVIDTGSEPVIPDIPGVEGSSRVVTSTELIATEELPQRLVVVGGGYVGIELAGMYAQFGSQVTVLESASRVFGREDDDVADAARAILERQGVTFLTSVRATSIQDADDGATVTYEAVPSAGASSVTPGGAVTGDLVLLAVGRRPVAAGLGLDVAGIRTTDRGAVEVDDHLRTNVPGVYAVGDVNGGPQFTYISLDDSRIVLDQLVGSGERSTADREAVPYTVFVSPPLARVGLTEREARAAGHDVLVASKAVAALAAMPRARIVEQTDGLMKFVVDATSGLVLGAALLCVDSQELINTVALAIRHGVSAAELRDAIYTHPSSTEGFNEVLASLA
ncbi:FAD-dependent oxidoreductase [Oerskovia sp. NPDC060338]|uniref:FAD-dependent oxidoreductase n=1 Tax=Oerskovia sp. NPDC060338 TaxID=3347100 RepID=UPI00365969BE